MIIEIPDEHLNDMMRETICKTIYKAGLAKWTNLVCRRDAVETTYEADWVKHMIVRHDTTPV